MKDCEQTADDETASASSRSRMERLEDHIRQLRQIERELRTTRRMYREILSAEWDAIIMLDADCRVLEANAAALQLYGYERDEFEGMPFPRLTPELTCPACQTGDSERTVHQSLHRRKNGSTFPAEVAARRFRIDGDERVCIVVRDVSERRWAEEELSRIRAAVDDASDAVVILDMSGTAVYANRAFNRMFGHTLQSVNEEGVQLLFTDKRIARQMLHVVLTGRRWVDEAEMVTSRGETLTVLLRGSPVRNPEGSIINVLLLCSDITEWKEFEEHLVYEATRDALTGLYNRRQLMARLEEAIYSARRYRFPLSVSLCDIDGFKSINDTHGHGAGDRVLASLGEIMSTNSRVGDIAGRYGGDEFCLVLPHTTAVAAANCVERIRTMLAEQQFEDNRGRSFSVTATFGIAELTAAHAGQNDLLVAADRALYRAKEEGRNRIVISPQDGQGQ